MFTKLASICFLNLILAITEPLDNSIFPSIELEFSLSLVILDKMLIILLANSALLILL